MLGNNPKGISYLVGFGSSFPQQVHHRGSSIISIKQDPQLVSCNDGFSTYYYSTNPNPNVHNGALVGGPDQNDTFQDSRGNYAMTEPATYNTAPLVGVFARLAAGGGSSGGDGAPTQATAPAPAPSSSGDAPTPAPAPSSSGPTPAVAPSSSPGAAAAATATYHTTSHFWVAAGRRAGPLEKTIVSSSAAAATAVTKDAILKP